MLPLSVTKTPPCCLPDLMTLVPGLSAALSAEKSPVAPLSILQRRVPQMMSTFPNEIVCCRQPSGSKRWVFLKYQTGNGHGAFGHRGNVPYEAEVYRRVLQRYPGFRPRYLGAYTEPKTCGTWLVLEYLDGCIRLCDMVVRRRTGQPTAMLQAARWIGKFQADHESAAGNNAFTFLKRYDAEYLQGWASRTLGFAKSLHRRLPWLEKLCCRADGWMGPLLSAAPVIIHGEFYAKNLLVRRQQIHVVDWESAAIAAGEIDLAALTEGRWPVSLVTRCERAYRQARWPEGSPANFRRTLEAARIYLHFRWLGERQDGALREKTLWRYEHLRATGQRLGIIS